MCVRFLICDCVRFYSSPPPLLYHKLIASSCDFQLPLSFFSRLNATLEYFVASLCRVTYIAAACSYSQLEYELHTLSLCSIPPHPCTLTLRLSFFIASLCPYSNSFVCVYEFLRLRLVQEECNVCILCFSRMLQSYPSWFLLKHHMRCNLFIFVWKAFAHFASPRLLLGLSKCIVEQLPELSIVTFSSLAKLFNIALNFFILIFLPLNVTS